MTNILDIYKAPFVEKPNPAVTVKETALVFAGTAVLAMLLLGK